MPSKQSQKAVTAKMYRHFAVVTVAVTGALALATDNESAAEFNETVDAQQVSVDQAGRDVKAAAEPTLKRRMASANEIQPAATGWGSDNSGSVTGGGASGYLPPNIQASASVHGVLKRLGITEEQFATLPVEDQQQLIRSASGSSAALSAKERAAQIRRVSDASRLRSGGGEGCADC